MSREKEKKREEDKKILPFPSSLLISFLLFPLPPTAFSHIHALCPQNTCSLSIPLKIYCLLYIEKSLLIHQMWSYFIQLLPYILHNMNCHYIFSLNLISMTRYTLISLGPDISLLQSCPFLKDKNWISSAFIVSFALKNLNGKIVGIQCLLS